MSERRPNVFGLSRDLWDHPLFAEEPFTEREAWAWLIGAAAWKTIQTRGNAGPVALGRGEFSFAVRFLAVKWQWDKSRVHRFIGRLIKSEMLREIKRDTNQVFIILNYNKFQVVGVGKRDTDETPARHERDTSETETRRERDKEETGETVKQGKQEEEIAAVAAPIQSPSVVSRETPKTDLFDIGDIPPALDRRGEKPSAEIVALVTQPEREIEVAVEAYNLTAEFAAKQGFAWPKCTLITDKRRKALKARLASCGGLEGWKMAMSKAAQSRFLLGKEGRSDAHKNWRPSIDFLIREDQFVKLMESVPDDEPNSAQGDGGQLGRLAEAAAYALAAGDPSH